MYNESSFVFALSRKNILGLDGLYLTGTRVREWSAQGPESHARLMLTKALDLMFSRDRRQQTSTNARYNYATNEWAIKNMTEGIKVPMLWFYCLEALRRTLPTMSD